MCYTKRHHNQKTNSDMSFLCVKATANSRPESPSLKSGARRQIKCTWCSAGISTCIVGIFQFHHDFSGHDKMCCCCGIASAWAKDMKLNCHLCGEEWSFLNIKCHFEQMCCRLSKLINGAGSATPLLPWNRRKWKTMNFRRTMHMVKFPMVDRSKRARPHLGFAWRASTGLRNIKYLSPMIVQPKIPSSLAEKWCADAALQAPNGLKIKATRKWKLPRLSIKQEQACSTCVSFRFFAE